MRIFRTSVAVSLGLLLVGCCGRSRSCCPPVATCVAPVRPAPTPLAMDRPMVLLETTFFQVRGPAAVDAVGATDGGGSRHLPATDLTALETKWASTSGVTRLVAPSVVFYEGEPATITMVEAPNGSQLADDIDSLSRPGVTGFVMRSDDRTTGERVELNLRAGWRAPGSPAPVHVEGRESVGPNEALLLWSPKTTPGADRMAILVRAQKVEPDSPPAKP